MRVFINPGHDCKYDLGAPASEMFLGLHEAHVARDVGALVDSYLRAAGCETRVMQSDNLCGDSNYPERAAEPSVCSTANRWGADVFVSLHCNSAGRTDARGTEVEVYARGGNAERLANCVLRQIVDSVGTVERGVNEKPGYAVLKHTSMPAVLVEMAFINNAGDVALLRDRQDDFARAIARGVTDYASGRP